MKLPGMMVDVVACVLISDFLSGLGHWLEDSFGTLAAPALLKRWIVIDNIRHHRAPGEILRQSWWECNRVLISVCGAICAICLISGVTDWRVYFIAAFGAQSNQIHRWAHQRKPPALIRELQRIGILQSRSHHAQHHRRPYAIRYCTSTNWLNPILDTLRFWRGAEAAIRIVFGIPVKRLSVERGGY